MPQITRRQRTEIATIKRNHQMMGGWAYGGNYRIQPQDKVLLERGSYRSYDVLRDILRDPHSFAVLQKRWLSVAEREWEVRPASEKRIDKKAAELVERQLNAIASFAEGKEGGELVPNIYGGFDQVCYNLLKAELYGFQPAEIIWDTDGKEIYPAQIKDKSPDRFVYLAGDRGYRFRLLTPENPWDGVPLPAKKFIIHTFHPEDENPYGWGMGGRLFYPVMFKRRLAEFALVYADKFGSPSGKATYPDGREDLKEALLDAMSNMAQESGIVVPEGCSFEWMTAQGQGTEVYTALMDYFDREISKTVLGETGSTDQQGSGGSRARDQIGNEVRLEITKASSDFLSSTLNRTLIRWITWYNFGNKAAPPSVWRKFPELAEKEDLNGRANRDNTISTMMDLKPTRKYIEETYSIELEEKNEDEQKQDGFSQQLAGIFGGADEGAAISTTGNEGEPGEGDGGGSEQGDEGGGSRDFGETLGVEHSLEVTDDSPSKHGEYAFSENTFDFKASKKVINWNGLDIGLEKEAGDRLGNSTILQAGRGHIRGYVGADKKALVVYVHQGLTNPGTKAYNNLYQITNLDKYGNFRRHIYMAGYKSKNAAQKTYLRLMMKSSFGGIKKISKSDLEQYRKVVKTPAQIFTKQAVKAVEPEVAKWRSQINSEVQRIKNLPIDDQAKFGQLEDSLYSLYSEMDVDEYGDILGGAIAAAEFAGRYEVTKTNRKE